MSQTGESLPSVSVEREAIEFEGRDRSRASSGLDDLSKLVALCKRRGFIFPSAEIYGGFANAWDYGPLGVLLKNNVRDAWILANVQRRDDVDLLDAAIITAPQVWRASGHVENFVDLLVQCLGECKRRYRADELSTEKCPECHGPLSEPRPFNGMFKTYVGPVEDETSIAYLRPETAQGQFVQFKNVASAMRRKLPFGIAQIGKSFRNEITPGNFVFRTREFEQMEIEYFVEPGTDERWFDFWVEARERWYLDLGLRRAQLRRFEVPAEERAHYSKRTVDLQYHYPFGKGWEELEGIANRGDYDLGQHEQFSGESLKLFDEEQRAHIRPFVVEPAAGLSRAVLTFLVDAYDEEPDKDEMRVVLRLHPVLAPYKVAVLPLQRKPPELIDLARQLSSRLRESFMATYDDTGSIGRRYRRQDEIGTPWCVTVDHQSLEDRSVTIRDRDSMTQVRVPFDSLAAWVQERLTF
jgi:glycyl-tRNA synthetase